MSADKDLREVLDALEMPRQGLEAWLKHMRRFCDEHGGARHYGRLLDLFDRCESALERRPAVESGGRASHAPSGDASGRGG